MNEQMGGRAVVPELGLYKQCVVPAQLKPSFSVQIRTSFSVSAHVKGGKEQDLSSCRD